jgi:hypothetical protein
MHPLLDHVNYSSAVSIWVQPILGRPSVPKEYSPLIYRHNRGDTAIQGVLFSSDYPYQPDLNIHPIYEHTYSGIFRRTDTNQDLLQHVLLDLRVALTDDDPGYIF